MSVLKYFIIGGAAAVVDIGLFTLFASYLGWSWIPVSIASFIFATFINYLLSIRFVFKSGIRYQKHIELIGIFIVSGLALLINQLILYCMIEVIGMKLIISKIIATSSVFFWNYFSRSKFIF